MTCNKFDSYMDLLQEEFTPCYTKMSGATVGPHCKHATSIKRTEPASQMSASCPYNGLFALSLVRGPISACHQAVASVGPVYTTMKTQAESTGLPQ